MALLCTHLKDKILVPTQNRLLRCHPGNHFPVFLQIEPKTIARDVHKHLKRTPMATQPLKVNKI